MKKLNAVIVLTVSLIMATGWKADCAEYPHIKPQICPQPLSCQLSSVEYVPFEKILLACGDENAAVWAKRHLKEWYGKNAPEVIVVNESPAISAEDEYRIQIGDEGVRVEAASIIGTRYALYSLRQIAIAKRGTLKVEGWIVPVGNVVDRPQMNFRGIHICWFHETEPWEVERLIRLAAYYKINYAVVESWGTFRSKVAPWFGWEDGSMTPKEVKRLNALARDLGITLIPQINVFGHATQARGGAGKHATLDINPEYQALFEPADGWNFCMSNPQTRKVLQDMIVERLEAFDHPPFFHIGGDEAVLPSCPDCVSQPYSELFLDHISAMNQTITSHGARTMMWHDMLLEAGDPRWSGFYANGNSETSDGFLKFPRDIIICDWYYGHAHDSYPTLDYFKNEGFSVLTCPWENTEGIISQGRYAHSAGLYGVLGTLWHHYFGHSLMNIYFTLSNIMWNPDAPVYGRGEYMNVIHTHLRQIGWDMNNKDARRGGTYYDEIPPEPFLNN